MQKVVVLAVAMLGLSACTGSGDAAGSGTADDASVDYAAWEAKLEAVNGYPSPHFETVRRQIENACKKSESDFSLYVAVALDRGAETALRTGISYACPERAREINDVLVNSADLDRICRDGVDWRWTTRRQCALLRGAEPPG